MIQRQPTGRATTTCYRCGKRIWLDQQSARFEPQHDPDDHECRGRAPDTDEEER